MLPCPVAVRAQTNAVQEQKGAMALTLKHAETMILTPAGNGETTRIAEPQLTEALIVTTEMFTKTEQTGAVREAPALQARRQGKLSRTAEHKPVQTVPAIPALRTKIITAPTFLETKTYTGLIPADKEKK